jgi:ferrochelatase
VLLVNLGTPASPAVADVRRYLREFLSDPRVIDMPAPLRWLLLHLVILPFRPRRSARAYAQIWGDDGSPLLVHSRAQCDAVAGVLGDAFQVELAMRYGEPSLRSALARLAAADVERLIVLPLFPQLSEAATASAVAKTRDELRRMGFSSPVEVRGAFYDAPGFIAAWGAVAGAPLAAFRPDHVLLSFHGLPERQVKRRDPTGRTCLASDACCDAIGADNRDCYRAQCFATARALARVLALAEGSWSVAFQSRLGPTPWIRPHTDRVLPELARRGVRRLAVMCPTFVADCLETLEEIGIRARDQWTQVGGEALLLVPSLNAEPAWAGAVADLVRGAQAGGEGVGDAHAVEVGAGDRQPR